MFQVSSSTFHGSNVKLGTWNLEHRRGTMPGIERFEDIQAWQEARVLVKMVYELCSGKHFAHDFGLRD
jgi:hypothetical protein